MQYHGMNFSSIIRCDHKIFYIWRKILLNSGGLVIEVTFFLVTVFLKSVVKPLKIRAVINFYAKTLKRFPEKYFCGFYGLGFYCQITFSRNFENNWNKNVNFHHIFRIILINENSFLQIYPNEMRFLAYWFWSIKWLFAKSVKITKERAQRRI